MAIAPNWPRRDYGIRSFTVSNSEYRRGLGPVLLQAHRDGIKSKSLIEVRLKANAFVKYDGVWIKKELAEKGMEIPEV